MLPDTVLVLAHGMDQATRDLVRVGCRLANLTEVEWNDSPLTSAKEDKTTSWLRARHSPSLVVGVLPAGERRVPVELARLATRGFTDTLLLLCQESLIHEQVVLNVGKIRLIGQPLSAELFARAIRNLLVDRSAISGIPPYRHKRILSGERWWAGCLITAEGADTSTTQDRLRTFCWISQEATLGRLSLQVPAVPWVGQPLEPAEIEPCRSSLEQWLQGEQFDELPPIAMKESGNAAVTVCLDTEELVAGVNVNGQGCWAWLISPTRIPQIWKIHLGGTNVIQPWRLRSGDLLVLHGGGLVDSMDFSAPHTVALRQAAFQGGEVLLRYLADLHGGEAIMRKLTDAQPNHQSVTVALIEVR